MDNLTSRCLSSCKSQPIGHVIAVIHGRTDISDDFANLPQGQSGPSYLDQ